MTKTLCTNHFCLSDGCYHNICTTARSFKIIYRRFAVAYSHSSISFHSHHSHRFAYHKAPAHHSHLPSLQFNTIVIQNLYAGSCRTRRISFIAAHENTCHGAGSYAIHIFFRCEGSTHCFIVYVFRQRSENQHTVYAVIIIYLLYFIYQFVLGNIRFINVFPYLDSCLFRTFKCTPLI